MHKTYNKAIDLLTCIFTTAFYLFHNESPTRNLGYSAIMVRPGVNCRLSFYRIRHMGAQQHGVAERIAKASNAIYLCGDSAPR